MHQYWCIFVFLGLFFLEVIGWPGGEGFRKLPRGQHRQSLPGGSAVEGESGAAAVSRSGPGMDENSLKMQ
jgi:hypothetical protein